MRVLLALLACAAAVLPGGDLPAPEETAALLLSPSPALRRRANEILQVDRGRGYERIVLQTVSRWAYDRAEWIEDLRRRTRSRDPRERARAGRMLSHLKPAPQLVSVQWNVVEVPAETARRILGPNLVTVVSSDAREWARWQDAITRAERSKVVFRGTAAGDDGEEVTAEARRSIAYISDFEVKGKPGAYVVDPVVDSLEVETSASWRPSVSPDRGYVTLRLTLSVADYVRPIALKERTIDGARKVKVQVPEVIRTRTKTTLTLPLAGHAAWSVAGEQGRRYVVLCRAVRSEPGKAR